jgi:plastocyanin
MSRATSRLAWIAAAATLITVIAIAPGVVSSSWDEVREIRLVARDMTYYVEGQEDPNPTLRVSRGERVRIRLINRDPGMTHDFGVRAWNAGTGLVTNHGEAVVELTAPAESGDASYACTPHGEMMRGTIRVE